MNSLLGLYETITYYFISSLFRNINPNTAGLTLAPFSKKRKCIGINGAIQLGLGALASFAVGVLLKIDVAYGFIMTVSTVLALIILILGRT
jgi:DHA1 family bicyclomycin/chloramphenicol resistance-like MFS transporter